jgi:predicted dehydrogenase
MNRIRIGIIGASGRAAIAKNWHPPVSGESLVAAAADTSGLALAECGKWAGPDLRMAADYREIAEAADLDAVAVFTPDRFHEDHALAVLKAGKHLFLEKPMTLSTEGCDRLLAAAREADVRFMIGFNLRYNPVANAARTLIQSGRIGEVKAIWVRHFVGAGGDFYFHDWHGVRADVHSLLLQKASHDLDLIHWLAGAYAVEVAAFGSLDYFGGDRADDLTCDRCDLRETCREAQARENPRQQCAFRREVDVEDNHVVILKLANGVKASYSQCHFTPEYLRNYTVIGTAGRLEFDLEAERLWVMDRPARTRDWPTTPAAEAVTIPRAIVGPDGHGGADPLITRAFLDLVLRGIPTVSTPEAGRMSVAAGCAAVQSLREGGAVRVPPIPSP